MRPTLLCPKHLSAIADETDSPLRSTSVSFNGLTFTTMASTPGYRVSPSTTDTPTRVDDDIGGEAISPTPRYCSNTRAHRRVGSSGGDEPEPGPPASLLRICLPTLQRSRNSFSSLYATASSTLSQSTEHDVDLQQDSIASDSTRGSHATVNTAPVSENSLPVPTAALAVCDGRKTLAESMERGCPRRTQSQNEAALKALQSMLTGSRQHS